MLPRYLTDFAVNGLNKYYSDFLVVGSGIAGLYTSLKLSNLGNVTILTKNELTESNTEYAQGGIAVALADEDSPRLHMEDTLKAGANFCDSQAVKVLVTDGPRCVEEIIEIGTHFDRIEGKLQTTLEAAHQRPRVLHAQGDATGAEIERALSVRVKKENKIRIKENILAVDLLTKGNVCVGLLALNVKQKVLQIYLARAIILASGGLGQLFCNTTNPVVATGDGMALAYRAGAKLANLEFIQFHPTALYYQGNPKFLISEAVRGEGAILKNSLKKTFMKDYHPKAELAPRDIVARAITDQMKKNNSKNVYLDATGMKDFFAKRFPTIYKNCLKVGINPLEDYIPVAPAAHYSMGGIKTDTWGKTNLKNLFACGECANTGVHGANRLASNSLLEGLVFGNRIFEKIKSNMSSAIPDIPNHFKISFQHKREKKNKIIVKDIRKKLQFLMWNNAGIIRNAHDLKEAISQINKWRSLLIYPLQDIADIELANLILLADLVVKSALKREESRGAHYRKDFPERDDIRWKKYIEH